MSRLGQGQRVRGVVVDGGATRVDYCVELLNGLGFRLAAQRASPDEDAGASIYVVGDPAAYARDTSGWHTRSERSVVCFVTPLGIADTVVQRAEPFNIWHLAGASRQFYSRDGVPRAPVLPVSEYLAGAIAALAIVAAIRRLAKFGRGTLLDIAAADALATLYVGFPLFTAFGAEAESGSRRVSAGVGRIEQPAIRCRD